MSLSLKVISWVLLRNARLDRVSAVRHSISVLEAMLTKASMAILRLLAMNSSWLTMFLNRELFYKVVMAQVGNEGFSFSSSCCEILKYLQVYEPHQSIVGQERGRTHRDLYECRKIN